MYINTEFDQKFAEMTIGSYLNYYHGISVWPTSSEILSDENTIAIKKNIIQGPYPNVDSYLDIHFRLLREDFVRPLRNDIRNHIAGRPAKTLECVIIHTRSKFIRPEVYNGMKCYKVHIDFKASGNIVFDKNDKRFIFGSLLCFTADNFRSLIFGRIVMSTTESLNRGEVLVCLNGVDGNNNSKIALQQNYITVECKNYFEAYYQVLKALKSVNKTNLPMQEYLVHVKNSRFIGAPRYLLNYRKNGFLNIFNESQYEAYNAAMSQELVLIQGPPGTGKTFLGLQIVASLLINNQAWYWRTPIILLCAKNESLDQFLEGLIKINITSKILRIGGQSKSKALEDYNIKKKKKKIDNKEFGKLYAQFMKCKTELDRISNLFSATTSSSQSYLKAEFDRIFSTYCNLNENIERFRQMEELRCMQDALIIGMTTSCASRLKENLVQLKSPIMIVEEAAEVLESHIVASLTAHCQHLILIGDHKQLQPSTADYTIEKDYYLGISLFERLILNNFKCYSLNEQHRMRPEISSLIAPVIYPNLKNSSSVLNRPNVRGIFRNLYFIDHHYSEKDSKITSKKNRHEAIFLVNLAKYLILNDYQSSQITILCTYSGQVQEIEQLLLSQQIQFESLRNIQIKTVDEYQGEENEIILLSLVRNNNEGKIGFLSKENRVCVALSRARNGLFIMGNINLLCSRSTLWRSIRTTLEEQSSIGSSLQLICPSHNHIIGNVSSEDDFKRLFKNGPVCRRKCKATLKCGHTCERTCHFNKDVIHDSFECLEICNKNICQSSHNTKCGRLCFQECNVCTVLVSPTYICGHIIPGYNNNVQCYHCSKIQPELRRYGVCINCRPRQYHYTSTMPIPIRPKSFWKQYCTIL